MDPSLLHAVNDFLFRHDAVEDPLLFYVNASEALFVATLAIVFLAAALGSAAALLLWTPPLRSRVDRLADWAGGHWDRTVERVYPTATS